jgi:hypothetical protein
MTTNQLNTVAEPSQYNDSESTEDGNTANSRNVLYINCITNNGNCLT